MSKAVLVLDEMPQRCADCVLVDLGDYGRDYCAKTERCIHDMNKKPDWCPLREMPEKRDVCGTYPREDEKTPSYFIGFNDCLRAIEGSGEDG